MARAGPLEVQQWVGEARLVVGGQSGAGGLAGTKPWPGCLGAGPGMCTGTPWGPAKMRALTRQVCVLSHCASTLLPGHMKRPALDHTWRREDRASLFPMSHQKHPREGAPNIHASP